MDISVYTNCYKIKEEGRVSRPGSMKKKSLYEKGYWPLSSINIPGKCDETVVKR